MIKIIILGFCGEVFYSLVNFLNLEILSCFKLFFFENENEGWWVVYN